MITIEHLEVRFEAERQRDELVFARLFATHIARHHEQREHAADTETRAQRERATPDGRDGW